MCCGRRPKKKSRSRGTKSGRITSKKVQAQTQSQAQANKQNEQHSEDSK